MQTGTTPARRIATEPASDRSAPPTGPCRKATAAPTASPPTAAVGVDPAAGSVRFAEVAA